MCDHIVVFSLIIDNLVLLVQGVLLILCVTGCEPVVNRTGAWVYFECVDTFEAHVAHAEVRVVEVLAHELTVRRVRDEGCVAVALAFERTVDVPRFVVELGRVAQRVSDLQPSCILSRDGLLQSLDRTIVFVDARSDHEYFVFYFSSIFQCYNVGFRVDFDHI